MKDLIDRKSLRAEIKNVRVHPILLGSVTKIAFRKQDLQILSLDLQGMGNTLYGSPMPRHLRAKILPGSVPSQRLKAAVGEGF